MNNCQKCQRDTPAFCGEKFCPLNLPPDMPLTTVRTIKADEAARINAQRYPAVLAGEIIGLLFATGMFLGASGMVNPYIGLLIVLGALALHTTARKAICG